MILVVVLTLASALSYGVSDFFGTLGARRFGVMPATTLTYLWATVALSAGLLVIGGTWSAGAVFWGAVSGVAAVVGFVLFYQALTVGPVSVLSPVIGLLVAGVPVGVATLGGTQLSSAAWVAVGLALASAVLVSTSRREGSVRVSRQAWLVGVGSGIAFGLSVVALSFAPGSAGLVPAFVEIGLGLLLLLLLGSLRRLSAGRRPFSLGPLRSAGPRWIGGSVIAGVLLGVGDTLLLAALYSGNLAVVGVLVALYPVATILLSIAVLGERLTLPQSVGVGTALASSALFALG